jgi:uncharacterized membrane protein YiaA
MTTDDAKGNIEAVGQGIRVIRRLTAVNLGLVALQPISAGLSMSGYGGAVMIHGLVALALQVGAAAQAVTAIVLWRRRRVPGWVAGFSVGLLVMMVLELAVGHSRRFWLHLPIGVGIFGGLMRQVNRLDTRSPGERST